MFLKENKDILEFLLFLFSLVFTVLIYYIYTLKEKLKETTKLIEESTTKTKELETKFFALVNEKKELVEKLDLLSVSSDVIKDSNTNTWINLDLTIGLLGFTLVSTMLLLFYLNSSHLSTISKDMDTNLSNYIVTELSVNRRNTDELIDKGSEGLTNLNTLHKIQLADLEKSLSSMLDKKLAPILEKVTETTSQILPDTAEMGVNTVLENPDLISVASDITSILSDIPPLG